MKSLSQHQREAADLRGEELRAGVACDQCGAELRYSVPQLVLFLPPRSAYVECRQRSCISFGMRRSKFLKPGELDGVNLGF
ncbi:MAG: hypothetical protein F4X64_02940 [Chloroflexi bacterium]|nr:hypothetical protein [Chloroflexota bacterium]